MAGKTNKIKHFCPDKLNLSLNVFLQIFLHYNY